MMYRKLITYSPYALSAFLLLLASVPIVASAQQELPAFMYNFVVSAFGMLAGITAFLLDYAINNFVINFGTNVTGTGIGAAIDTLWSIVRDFFNIIFIFAIIYLGFKMILGSDDSGTKRALVYLVIAALLVNFSLFISKFIVDFSNSIAREVAMSTFAACDIPGAGNTCGTFSTTKVDVGERFFNMMKLPTTLDNSDRELLDGSTNAWGYIIGILIVFVVSTFAFISGAILLIIRFAVLCVFMVLSPFMFIGWILPQYKGLMGKYWSGFLGRAFYAPAYILMLYFSGAVIVASFANLSTTESIAGAFTAGAVPGAITNIGAGLGPFILSSVFLIMSVQVASKLSADGAGTAMKVGGNLARGGRRFAARNTLGFGAYGLSATGRGGGKLVDRLDAASNNTRTGRNWRRFANTVTLGATSHSALKGVTTAAAGASVGGSKTREQYLKDERDRKKVRDRVTSRDSDEGDIDAAEGIDRNRTDLTDQEIEKLNKAEAAANRYTPTELEEMSAKKRTSLVEKGLLKAPTIAKLLGSDNLSSAEKKEIAGGYEKVILDQVTENGEVVTDQLAKLSKTQMQILGDEFTRDYAAFFSEGQMEDYYKDDNVSERQKGLVKTTRKSMLTDIANGKEIRMPKYDKATGKKEYVTKTQSKTLLFAESKRIRTKDGYSTASVINDKGDVHKLKASEVGARPFSAFVGGDGQLRDGVQQHVTADVLKQIARSANQGKPTMSAEERTQLAELLLSDNSITPAVANYLTNKKGQEDFLLDLTPGTVKKVKDGAEINRTGGSFGL